MIIILLILVVALIISMYKWYCYFHGLSGLIHYMEINKMREPTEEEKNDAINWAIKNSISITLRKIETLNKK